MKTQAKNIDRFLIEAYAKCHCDKFSLDVPSFRQWYNETFGETWTLTILPAHMYAATWGHYILWVNNVRERMARDKEENEQEARAYRAL